MLQKKETLLGLCLTIVILGVALSALAYVFVPTLNRWIATMAAIFVAGVVGSVLFLPPGRKSG
jgi:hypothetical protein